LNPEKSVKATWGFYRVICSKFGVGLTVLLTLLSWYLLGLNGLEVAENLTVLKVDNWWSLVLLYVCVLITTVFHELGHIHICVKNGGKVKKFGIMLFFFNLSFYCDVSDIYMLGDSRVKRHVALGGVYINYIASRLALILYILCLMNGHNYVTVLYYYILNLGFAIFNLNPFVRLDGYWVLASIAKIDNLMDKCVLYMLSCFYDRDLVRRAGLRGRKKVLVFLYGVAVCIVRPLFWLVGVSYLYEILNKNFGIWAASGVLVILVLIIIWDTLKLILYYKNAFLKDRERIVMLI
jgi:putative peptide zinc metalloprotease protein